jgi:GAF domain-containing protein
VWGVNYSQRGLAPGLGDAQCRTPAASLPQAGGGVADTGEASESATVQQVTPLDSTLASLGAYEPARAIGGVPRLPRSRNAERLAIEHAVTDALARSADLKQAGSSIVRAVGVELGWACGSCWIQDEQGGPMVCIGTWGGLDAATRAVLDAVPMLSLHTDLVPGSGGLLRRAWSTGQPVWLVDVTAEPTFKRAALAARAGLRSALAFPITAAGRVVGVVEVFSRDVHEIDADLLDCTRYIGSQIGQFYLRTQAQAQLRASEQRHASTIELAAIGIAYVDDAGRYIHVNP